MASLSQKDIKLLWGRAANRCGSCRTELSFNSGGGSALPLGEQAHIVAEESTGPRGDSPLTSEERNSYANMILLCPTCHTKVDKAPADFPVERLHHLKTQHELWVSESLSAPTGKVDPADLLYSDLVDHVTTATGLSNWKAWTSYTLSPNQAWPAIMGENVFELTQRMQGALWPGKYPELERSMQTFTQALAAAFELFSEHCTRDGSGLRGVRFYKLDRWNPELYQQLSDEYGAWTRACDELMREATRAANWFADCVRREINPQYFLLEGRFALLEGPDMNLSYHSVLCVYSDEERATLPQQFSERVDRIKNIEPAAST